MNLSGPLTGDLNNTGNVAFSGDVTGNVVNDGNFNILSNTQITGSLTNNSSITQLTGNNLTMDVSGTFTNNASVDAGSNGSLVINAGTVILGTSSVVSGDVQIFGGIINNGGINYSVDTDLHGSMTNTSTGTILVDATVTSNNSFFDNSGDVDVTANGTLTDVSNLTNNGSLDIAAGGTVSAGTIDNQTNGILNNAGTLSGNLTNSGALTSTGTIDGTVTNTGGLTLAGTITGNLNQQGGSLTLTNGLTVGGAFNNSTNIGTITQNMSVGAMDNSGTILMQGNLVSTGGAIVNTGAGNLTLAGTTTGNVTSSSGATLVLTGGLNGDLTTNGTTSLENQISGDLNVLGGQTDLTGNLTVGGVVDNSGTLVLDSGETLTAAGLVTNNNSGIMTVAGTLAGNVANAGNLSNSGTISGDLTNSGGLTSTGTIGGAVINNGSANLTGTVIGAVTNSAGGNLNTTGNLNIGSLANSGAVIVGSGTTTSVTSGSVTNSGSGNLIVDGTLSANVTNAGNLSNAGTLSGNIINDGTLNSSGNIGGTLTNNNTATLSGTVIGGVSNNASGSMISNSALTADINNAGTLVLNSGLTGSLTNSGTANIAGIITGDLNHQGGSLNFSGDITVNGAFSSFANAAIASGQTLTAESFTNNTGAVFMLSGTVDAMNTQNNGLITANSGASFANSVTNAGTINAAGNLSFAGNLTHTGTIDTTGNGSTGDTVNIAGSLSGSGGTIRLDLDLGNETADTITVNGPATGHYTLDFNLLGNPNNTSTSNILVFDVDDSNPGTNTFSYDVINLPFTSDRFVYSTDQLASGDVVVVSQINPGVSSLSGSATLTQSLIGAIINRPTSPFVVGLAYEDQNKPCGPGGWARATGGYADVSGATNNGTNTHTSEITARYAGLQFGGDFACFNGYLGGWDIALGIIGGVNEGSTRQPIYAIDPVNPGALTNTLTSVTKSDFNQKYLGAYMTAAKGPFSADVQFRRERTDFTLNNTPAGVGFAGLGLTDVKFQTNAYTLSGSLSYAFQLKKEGWGVIPTAGFAYTQLESDLITFDDNATLQIKDSSTRFSFAGVTISKTTIGKSGNSALNRFVTATYYHDFSPDTESVYTGVGGQSPELLSSSNLGSYQELSLGMNYVKVLNSGSARAARQFSASVRADARFGRDLKSAGITAQIRWQF